MSKSLVVITRGNLGQIESSFPISINQAVAQRIDSMADDIYRYLNFDQIVEFQKSAEEGARIAAVEIQEVSV